MKNNNIAISFIVLVIIIFIGLYMYLGSIKNTPNTIKTNNDYFVNGNDDFYDVWGYREDIIYTNIFPNIDKNIYVPINGKGISIGGDKLLKSRWGVFEVPPSEGKEYYTYITSGISNPFKTSDTPGISGFGFELKIQTKNKSPWAINLLFNLMGYILETGTIMTTGDVMPLKNGINKSKETLLVSLIFSNFNTNDYMHELKSGKFNILHITGITQEEENFTKDNSVKDLMELLKLGNVLNITDPERKSIIIDK